MKYEEFKSEKVPLIKLGSKILGKFDLLICAASYEERCLSVPLCLTSEKNLTVLILKNDDVAGTGSINANHISKHFGKNATIIEITKRIAIRTADRIANAILEQENTAAPRVCVDTTCMTHETLLILHSLLNHLYPESHSQVQYLYCPAKEYDPGVAYERKWLSRGIKGVRSILGYPGKLLPSRKNRLLVLVGFEVDRASGLIDVYEPAKLTLGYGDGSLSAEHQIVNTQKHSRMSDRYPSADSFEFSPADAFAVKDLIVAEAKKYSEFNLIVAPMNSKITTIGAALATLEKPEIQLCYAPAVTYNFENYSLPDDHCLMFHT